MTYKNGAKVDWEFYRQAVQSEECACGRTKKSGFPFCLTCFRALPDDLQNQCAFGFHKGLPEAYEAAVKWLEE